MSQIQGKAQFAAGATAPTIAISNTGSGGTRSLVLWLWITSATAPLTLSDNLGGSLAGGQWKQRDGNAGSIFLFDYLGCPSGINLISLTKDSAYYNAFICERDDIAAFSQFRFNEFGPAGAGGAWTSLAVTTSANPEIGMGYASTFSGGGQGFAPSGGWANGTGTGVTSGNINDAGNGNTGFIENQALSASTSYAATGTVTSASYVYGAIGTYTQLSSDTLMGQGAY